MATDNSTPTAANMAQNATQAEMDDILSSIRTTMVEEGAKVGTGSADLIDAAAAQDGAEDDVLDLSDADMVPAAENHPGTSDGDDSDELIDISAFASSGEAKPVDEATASALADDVLGEKAEKAEEAAPEAEVSVEAAADEFDRLLAEISQEQKQQVVASAISKQDLMDEEPLGSDVAVEADAEADVVDEALVDAVTDEVVEAVAPSVAAPAATMSAGGASFALSSVQGPEGVQIAFPAEVLAMALRPMVQEWLTKNLPSVVEKLVQEEISKLTQN